MPNPSKEELKNNDRDGFISRCIEEVKAENSGMGHDQIVAMCYTKWREGKDAQKDNE